MASAHAFDAASATSGGTELLLSRKTVLNEAVDWDNSVCPGVPGSAQASGYSALGNLTQRYELVEDVSPGAVLSRQCSRTSSAFDEGFAPLASGWWVRPKFRTSPAGIGQSAAKHVSRINDLRDLYARKIETHVVSRLVR